MAPRLSQPNISELTQALEPDLLRRGDRGAAIARLQTVLRSLQLYPGDITGEYDELTAQAVMQLQRQVGVDDHGEFDQATWYALSFWVPDSGLTAFHDAEADWTLGAYFTGLWRAAIARWPLIDALRI